MTLSFTQIDFCPCQRVAPGVVALLIKVGHAAFAEAGASVL